MQRRGGHVYKNLGAIASYSFSLSLFFSFSLSFSFAHACSRTHSFRLLSSRLRDVTRSRKSYQRVEGGNDSRRRPLALVHQVGLAYTAARAVLLDHLEQRLQLRRRLYLGHEFAQRRVLVWNWEWWIMVISGLGRDDVFFLRILLNEWV